MNALRYVVQLLRYAYKNTFCLTGRMKRKDFWILMLLMSVIILAVQVICYILLAKLGAVIDDRDIQIAIDLYGYLIVGVILFFLTVIPLLTASVRRLHDAGKSGWNLAIPWVTVFVCDLIFYGTFNLSVFIHGPIYDILEAYDRFLMGANLGNLIIFASYAWLIYLWVKPSIPEKKHR